MIRGVSTALYGWMERFARDGVEWDWDSLYGACAEAGVDAVETDPLPHKLEVLQRLGLTVSSSYVGLPLHLPWPELQADKTIWPIAERLASVGGTDLVMNADQADWENPIAKDDDDARRQGENLTHCTITPTRSKPHSSTSTPCCVTPTRPSAYALTPGGRRTPVTTPSDGFATIRNEFTRSTSGTSAATFQLRTSGDGEMDISYIVEQAVSSGFTGWLGIELWHPDGMVPSRSMVEDVRRSAQLLRTAARLQ
ncbi:hypothetical protein [Leifsonia xyli]|uniref:hypothetical protein n=1 Tax=Leifsonia xyli TaxID=1575 RepID=UPI003D66969F